MEPTKLAALSKDELLAALETLYKSAQPINDQLVDVSLEIQSHTQEIYRRAILKRVPGVEITRVKTIMRIGCSIRPQAGLPKLDQQLTQLAEKQVEIERVLYDENTGEFSFLGTPEF